MIIYTVLKQYLLFLIVTRDALNSIAPVVFLLLSYIYKLINCPEFVQSLYENATLQLKGLRASCFIDELDSIYSSNEANCFWQNLRKVQLSNTPSNDFPLRNLRESMDLYFLPQISIHSLMFEGNLSFVGSDWIMIRVK